ncbi:hypothetical protein GCM10009743_34000 [Kribbella swartbergensis]
MLGAVLLGIVLLVLPVSASAAQPLADPTPSPTLGSTESPNPNPPGAQDSDPDDYTGAPWVVIGVAVVVVLVAGGTLLVMRSRRGTPVE